MPDETEAGVYAMCGACHFCCIGLGVGDPEVIAFKERVEQGLPVEIPQCEKHSDKPCQGTLELIEIYAK